MNPNVKLISIEKNVGFFGWRGEGRSEGGGGARVSNKKNLFWVGGGDGVSGCIGLA